MVETWCRILTEVSPAKLLVKSPGLSDPALRPRALERFAAQPENTSEHADAARQLIARVLEKLSPQARLVITLLEIEDRSVKEIAVLTGWSVPLVKVRAFRARAEMRKILARIARDKYL